MVKIFQTPSGPDPIGAVLRNLGQRLWGDQTANALRAEQLYALQRGNTEMDNLMRHIANNGGMQMLGADPILQATAIGAGYDPRHLAQFGLMGAATQFGATDPRTQNWQIGAGQGYGNTFGAFDATLKETARANDLASADRRYSVDRNFELGKYTHDTPSGADILTDQRDRWKHTTLGADTKYRVDADVGQKRYEFDNALEPVMGPNGPTFVPRSQVAGSGVQPILSETQQKGALLGQNFGNLSDLTPEQQAALGAGVSETQARGRQLLENWDTLDQLTPEQRAVLGAEPNAATASGVKNYILPDGRVLLTRDGQTDMQGNPLPPGGYLGTVEGSAKDVGVLTNAATTAVQEQKLAVEKFRGLLALTREVAEKDPTNFGLPGFIKGTVADVAALANGIAIGLGYDGAAQAINDARQRALANGISPSLISGLFDENLASLHTVSDLLVYSAAEALAGQSGRSVSNKDVEMFKEIVGDPQSWLMSQERFLAKLNMLERIVNTTSGVLDDALFNGLTPGQSASQQPGAQQPTQQPRRTSTGVIWSIE
jgi:hypothetical protein